MRRLTKLVKLHKNCTLQDRNFLVELVGAWTFVTQSGKMVWWCVI